MSPINSLTEELWLKLYCCSITQLVLAKQIHLAKEAHVIVNNNTLHKNIHGI